MLVLGALSMPAMAANECSDPLYNGVLDGNIHPAPTNFKIDTNCTVRNYPGGMSTNFTFADNDASDDVSFLIVFDNVVHTGNVSCNKPANHKLWFVNGSSSAIQDGCQHLLIPVEKIDKRNPAGTTTATVGVPFTYTLTMPVLFDPGTGSVIDTEGSLNQLHSVTLTDDLNATGVDLTYVSHVAYLESTGQPVSHSFSNVGNVLTFGEFMGPQSIIPAGEQVVIEITVVLDNTLLNATGKQFYNTAKWIFGRLIDDTFYAPLPGEWGVSEPMTITAPKLVVNKSGTNLLGGPTINLGEWGLFTIDVWNDGGSDAWSVTVLDRLPDGPSGGMCDLAPSSLSVTLNGNALTQGADYSSVFAGAPACTLTIALLEAAGPIGPDEHLIIDYQTKLDADTQNGTTLTNIAGAISWFNDDSSNDTRLELTDTLTNGTVGTDDNEDAHTVSVLLSGYFFEKTVSNVTTGIDPATLALPGDTLHYRLRLQATDYGFTDVIFHDQLPADFVAGSLVIGPLPAGAVNNSNTATGLIDISNLDLAAGSELLIEFDSVLKTSLVNGTIVSNQAQLLDSGRNLIGLSDDPNVNGQANPDPLIIDEDSTDVLISAPPAAPTKALVSPAPGIAEATIGQEVVYQLRVPGEVSNSTYYDIQVTDILDSNLEYVSAVVSGVAGATNSSSSTLMDISIPQIPAGQQAVIELRTRVRNVLPAQQGVGIDNSVSFTYASTPGGNKHAPLTSGSVGISIVEPGISAISKSANQSTVSAGDIVRYSVTMTAGSGASASNVYDLTITDTLDAGLAYAGNPTVTGAGNTIGTPFITGDGSNGNPQVLVWSPANGSTDIDINEGQSITVSYDVRVLNSALPDQNLSNSVVTRWTGIDGLNNHERDGSDGIGLLNDYVTAPAVATVAVLGARPTKVLLSPSPGAAEATIGQEVIYQLTVPGELSTSTLYDVQVTDVLDVNLEYVSAAVAGVAGAVNNSTAGQMNISIPQIPAGEQAVIELHARVRNLASAQQGFTVENSGAYTYATTPGGALQPVLESLPVAFNIVEPNIGNISKSADVATATAGDIIRYSVTLTADSGVDASNVFDAAITDNLGPDLAYSGNPTVTGAGNSIGDPVITGDGSEANPQTLVWSQADGNADIDIAEGDTITIAYDVLVLDSVEAFQPLENSVTVQWTGQEDAPAAYERTGAGCPDITQPDDYCAAPVEHSFLSVAPVLLFEKTVVSGTAAIPDDVVRYRLELTNESDLPFSGFSLVDDLDQLNSPAIFVPGTLQLVSALPAGATDNSDPTGGVNGTGRLDIRNLSLGAVGTANDSLALEFTVQLVPVIANGTTVLNQSHVFAQGIDVQASDDPSLPGINDPTPILITSAPEFVVEKTSQDLTLDSNVLMAGETLRYTISVKNTGNDNASDTVLRDQIPVNTTYVAGSTTLNGQNLADISGASPLLNGLPISTPEDPTPGTMLADPANTQGYYATITFDVVVDLNVIDGTVVSNQAFVDAIAGGVSDIPSDDPDTSTVDDPTRDIVGNLPLLFAEKSAALVSDGGIIGAVESGDVLRYTIAIHNDGNIPATAVVLTDAVPANTTYVANSLTLNGAPAGQSDNGISPLIAGLDVSSADLAPPFPAAGAGTINPGEVAIVQFDLAVNANVPGGTLITNQATVSSEELANLLTDGDGNPATGPEPTIVVVGNVQQLAITKQVTVVGGGPALPGATVEYLVRVTNIGMVPATGVVVTEDLNSPVSGQVSYVAQSATMNGSTVGTSFAGSVLTANYSAINGALAAGQNLTLRFRALLAASLTDGTTVTKTAVVNWNTPSQTASASASMDVGGIPGVGQVSGAVWHDGNFDRLQDTGETSLDGWSVELLRNSNRVFTAVTDTDGAYRISGLSPNDLTGDSYELRFIAPGAGATTAMLGYAHSPFTNGLQNISQVIVSSGSNLLNLNLPLQPNGVVYDSVARTPVSGATLTLLDSVSGAPLPSSCFDDPQQQNQVSGSSGFYRFDLNFSSATCPSGANYAIQVIAPGTGFVAGYSQIIPPASDQATPFSVPTCPGTADDALPATEFCEVQVASTAPGTAVAARSSGTDYYVYLLLSNGDMPGSSQIFNNHIPLDPVLEGAISISKTSPMVNVNRGQLVPYTIRLNNSYGIALQNVSVVDRFPPGFHYIEGSARLNGADSEPEIIGGELIWRDLTLAPDTEQSVQLLLGVGAGVSEGEFINRAQAVNSLSGGAMSGVASATVRLVPDPTFDCTDVVGKVYDDQNRNGQQDEEEAGIPGVRVVTARGLAATTDAYGRFHFTCPIVPNESRGSNFVLKLDDRTLPSGYRASTELLQVQRATRGKTLRFNFGASIHRVVGLDIADAVFEPGTTDIRPQWVPRFTLLLEELQKGPAILRLSYLADVEDENLVERRLRSVKKHIVDEWKGLDCCYRLVIEPEIFWRLGGPAEQVIQQKGERW